MNLWASVIADGHHLPASMVQTIVRSKTPARLLLTCDASPLAGLPPGRYRQWEQDLDISPEGKIVVAGTPFLAGSWAFTDTCVRNVMAFAGLPLADAIDLAGAQPRRILGIAAAHARCRPTGGFRPLRTFGRPAVRGAFDRDRGEN